MEERRERFKGRVVGAAPASGSHGFPTRTADLLPAHCRVLRRRPQTFFPGTGTLPTPSSRHPAPSSTSLRRPQSSFPGAPWLLPAHADLPDRSCRGARRRSQSYFPALTESLGAVYRPPSRPRRALKACSRRAASGSEGLEDLAKHVFCASTAGDGHVRLEGVAAYGLCSMAFLGACSALPAEDVAAKLTTRSWPTAVVPRMNPLNGLERNANHETRRTHPWTHARLNCLAIHPSSLSGHHSFL